MLSSLSQKIIKKMSPLCYIYFDAKSESREGEWVSEWEWEKHLLYRKKKLLKSMSILFLSLSLKLLFC